MEVECLYQVEKGVQSDFNQTEKPGVICMSDMAFSSSMRRD